jgi:hypothetical protein
MKGWVNMTISPPDFDQMISIAEKVGELTKDTLQLDIMIKDKEARTVREVLSNPIYFKDGKCLAMSVIESTYKYQGLEGELIPLRFEYATKKGELDKYKLMFQALQDCTKIFQTESSNMRGSLLGG